MTHTTARLGNTRIRTLIFRVSDHEGSRAITAAAVDEAAVLYNGAGYQTANVWSSTHGEYVLMINKLTVPVSTLVYRNGVVYD